LSDFLHSPGGDLNGNNNSNSTDTTSLFKGDTKAPLLITVLSNLQSLTWERHSVHFSHPMGHDLIIGKFEWAVDVMTHAVDHFLV